MLYEMIGIIRPGNLKEVKEIVMSAGSTVLKAGGVVRSLDNWGVFALPRALTKNAERFHNGHYFVLRYDAGARVQEELRRNMRVDPRVLRATSVKLGDGRLETLGRFGQTDWVAGS